MQKIVLRMAMIFWVAASWGQSLSTVQQSSKGAPEQIRIAAKNSTIVAGDAVYVITQFENTSDHPIETTVALVGGVDRRYAFHVTAENGTLLEPKVQTRPSIGGIGVTTMQPGQKEDSSFCLSCRYHDLTAVGKYKVYATRTVQDGTTVKSNEITITVIPK